MLLEHKETRVFKIMGLYEDHHDGLAFGQLYPTISLFAWVGRGEFCSFQKIGKISICQRSPEFRKLVPYT